MHSFLGEKITFEVSWSVTNEIDRWPFFPECFHPEIYEAYILPVQDPLMKTEYYVFPQCAEYHSKVGY